MVQVGELRGNSGRKLPNERLRKYAFLQSGNAGDGNWSQWRIAERNFVEKVEFRRMLKKEIVKKKRKCYS